jgi:hypothetical protein
MTSPALSICFIGPQAIQTSTGIRFEIAHEFLRPIVRFHDRVNVIGPYMRSQQIPSAMQTDLTNGVKYSLAESSVQEIRSLVHQSAFGFSALRMSFQHSASRQIVALVDGTRFIAVQMIAIAGECYEISRGLFWLP